MKKPDSRLAKALKENVGKYTVDRDGRIHVDLNNAKVQAAIKNLLEKFRNIA